MSNFIINTEWMSSDFGPKEIRDTSAMITIQLNDVYITRAEEDWSKSVRNGVRLSAYPLALWFASAWWRLIWEPVPNGIRGVDWRMSHEAIAAGYGYLWPRLTFESDGEYVDVVSRSTSVSANEPVRYLENFSERITVKEFSKAVDDFISLVVNRLSAVGIQDTDLQKVWFELLSERNAPKAIKYRKLEARLGADPDDIPESTIERFLAVSERAGASAMEEIAPVCAGANPTGNLEKVFAMSLEDGVKGRFSNALFEAANGVLSKDAPPWERGRELARNVRTALGRSVDQVVSNADISDLLSIPASKFDRVNVGSDRPLLGLAVRSEEDENVKLHFRKRNLAGLRFEAARFVADRLFASKEDGWLPVTDSRTGRQKAQRAFAAEFLCPINALQDHLGGDYSSESIEDAADHFQVSPLAVRSHLVNNGLLPHQVMYSARA